MRYLPSSAQRRQLNEDILPSGPRRPRLDSFGQECPENHIEGQECQVCGEMGAAPDPFSTAPELMGARSNIAGQLPLDQFSPPHQAKQSGIKSPPPNISPRM